MPRGIRVCQHTKRMVLKHLSEGKDVKEIEYWFGISAKCIGNWQKKYDLASNRLDYKPRSGGPKGRWRDRHLQIAVLCIKINPSIYLHELQFIISKATNDGFDLATIWRHLRKNRFTHKVLTRRFRESNPYVELLFWKAIEMNDIHINQLMWMDESYICRLSSNRRKGWALRFVYI